MSLAIRLCAKAKSASVVIRANATAEAAEAILTKLLLETRYPFGRASVSRCIVGSPYKVVAASAHTRKPARIPHQALAGCVVRIFRLELSFSGNLLFASSFRVTMSQANVFDGSEK
jgi:hypothetical protein